MRLFRRSLSCYANEVRQTVAARQFAYKPRQKPTSNPHEFARLDFFLKEQVDATFSFLFRDPLPQFR